MKKLILILTFLSFNFSIKAQEKINYTDKSKKIEFEISKDEFYTEFSPNDTQLLENKSENDFQKLNNNSAIVKFKNLTGDFTSRKNQMKTQISIQFERIEPVLIYRDGTKQIAKGEANIKLKPNVNIQDVIKDLDFGFEPNSLIENLYLISSKSLSTYDLFKTIDKLQADNRIEYIEPNFIRLLAPHTNDPLYSSQWSVNNQGYYGGVIDADMDVEEAWSYTTGNDIKVAIIDEGVDLNHPDLMANLLLGYDATGGNSNGGPNITTDDSHGTACAGIVAAVGNNNLGVAGIAYN